MPVVDASGRENSGDVMLPAEVHQATGMVSVQMDVSLDTALLCLRTYARELNEDVLITARRVLHRTLRFDPFGSSLFLH